MKQAPCGHDPLRVVCQHTRSSRFPWATPRVQAGRGAQPHCGWRAQRRAPSPCRSGKFRSLRRRTITHGVGSVDLLSNLTESPLCVRYEPLIFHPDLQNRILLSKCLRWWRKSRLATLSSVTPKGRIFSSRALFVYATGPRPRQAYDSLKRLIPSHVQCNSKVACSERHRGTSRRKAPLRPGIFSRSMTPKGRSKRRKRDALKNDESNVTQIHHFRSADRLPMESVIGLRRTR